MKILVTGANGQLGRELQTILPTSPIGAGAIFTDIDTLDLTNPKAIETCLDSNDITHIVNCAAYTAVDKAEEQKRECALVNVDAVKHIASAADARGIKVIHISTDYVFDGTAHRPYKESDKVNPISQYGTTKRLGETALLALAPESIIIRTAWLYSPHGHNFVNTILHKLSLNQPLNIVADQIGTPTYARDLAQAITQILSSNQWVEGIFHYTNAGVASWYDFAMAIAELTGHQNPNIKPITTDDYPTPASRPYYSVLDKSRIRATYSVTTPHWRQSLAQCLNQIKQ